MSRLIAITLIAFAVPIVADTYVPTPVEDMVKRADLIIEGTVVDYYTEVVWPGTIWRYTTVRIDDTVKADRNQTLPEAITIENEEGSISEGDDGPIKQLFDFRPVFAKDEKVLVLLALKENGNYEVSGSFRGKLGIGDEKVIGSISPSLEEFKEEMRKSIDGLPSRLSAEFPSLHEQLAAQSTAKVTSDGYHLNQDFNAFDIVFHPPNHAMTFHINETDAEDRNCGAITFNDLETAFESSTDEWNSLDDANIDFSVASTSTSDGYNPKDNKSVISFVDLGQNVGARISLPKKVGGVLTSDIRYNTQLKWNTAQAYPSPGSCGTPKDFMDVSAHELGHAVALVPK